MDGITPPSQKPVKSLEQTIQEVPIVGALKHDGNRQKVVIKLKLPKFRFKASSKTKKFYHDNELAIRIGAGLMAVLIVFSMGYEIYNWRYGTVKYQLSTQAEQLLGASNPLFAAKLEFDSKNQQYTYNAGYTPSASTEVAGMLGGPRFSGTFPLDPTKSVAIKDAVNSVELKLTPKFNLDTPQKKENRLIYPITGMHAAKVYTLRADSTKEDLVIEQFTQKSMQFKYALTLSDGTEARMESDGSIGIYGIDSVLLGKVTAGTQKDQDLLNAARKNGQKTKLLFTIPAPFVIDATKRTAQAKAWYSLENNIVTLHADGLDSAKYPLTIDPSVYIESAQQLMKGNNETNVDYDVNNSLIQKGKTTGARINSWGTTGTLASAAWDQGTVAAGGYVYSVGGQTVSTNRVVLTATSATSFVVPVGVTTITVKAWGAGGGGGAGDGTTGVGGAGGAGGYAKADLTVTPGETLNTVIGTGGAPAAASSNAGNGGGYTAIKRAATFLVQAGAGGGGGGSHGASANGGAGGAGGGASGTAGGGGVTSYATGTITQPGTTAITGAGTTWTAAMTGGTIVYSDGTTATFTRTGNTTGTSSITKTVTAGSTYTIVFATGGAGGGGGGTNAAGGTAGTVGTGGVAGTAGAANAGGDGGGSAALCTTAPGSTGGAGGSGGGGQGGNLTACAGGGGGGGGRFGGGGGGSADTTATRSGGGGGGGSDLVTGANTVETAGSGTTPGNSADTDRNGAGNAGVGGVSSFASTKGEDGIIIITYSGASTTTVSQTVNWAHFNSSTKAIESPNPGAGTCSGWCTNSVYDLPAARKGFSLVAYNGYLYALGGTDGTTRASTVYIAKIGANGEPQLWHPTGGTPVYWYTDTGLNGATARSYFSAVAYNNRMYILGGQTNASTGGTTTVEYANINPNGTLSTWTAASGGQLLPYVLHSFNVQSYNDTLYIIGGNSNGTLKNQVYYVKLNADGSLNSWVQTNSFVNARSTMGGTYSALWGAYLYLGGGCTAVNGSGYCTTPASDVQLASINADGSIAEWNSILNINNDMFSYSMLAWQGGLYRMGGCMSQDPSTGACFGVLANIDFGVVNQDGDASTVSNSSPSGTAPCNGANPTNCDLPPPGDAAGQGGQMSSMVVINNGYIYNIGGCTDISSATNECSTGTGMSGNTSYATLNSTGQLSSAPTCAGTTYGLWCVDSTHQINGTAGVGAAAATVFNNTIYVIGGTDGTGTWTSIVYRTALNADGSLAGGTTWTTGDGTGTTGLPGSFPGVNAAGGAITLGTAGMGYGYAFTRANPGSASSTPGNLYYLGGCNGAGGVGCSNYTNGVYKCNLGTAGAITGCATTGQMQIDADNINTGNQGLGLMAGAVYANRLYLVGGACTQPTASATTDPCGATYSGNRQDTIYAKIDNSNNIVDNTTGLSTGTWKFTTGKMNPVRRRAVSFGYNGYIYSLAGYSGSASLQDLLFAKIDVSTGDMGNFSSSGVVVTPRWDLRAIVSNGYVYAIGGCGTGSAPAGCTAMQPQIQTFQLYNNDSGAAASYTTSAGNFSNNTDRWGASSVILNGYIYVAGGCTSATDCTTTTSDVQYAQLSATDGTIGSWAAGGSLPAGRAWGQLVTAGGTLYYVGGQLTNTASAVSTIYYTTGISSGNPTWNVSATTKGIGDTGAGAQARTQLGVAVWNNFIYVVAGTNGTTVQNTVYVSPQLNSGGDIASNWIATRPISVPRSGLAVMAYANNLYIFGGVDSGGNYLNDSQFAQIGAYSDGTIAQAGTAITGTGTSFQSSDTGGTITYSDGVTATATYGSATTLTSSITKAVSSGSTYIIRFTNGAVGGWNFSTPLPGRVSQASAFGANGYIYLIGGRSASNICKQNALVAPVSANTTIASGNEPTGIGDWYSTNIEYAGGRYGAAVSYASGKAYVMGGGCTAPIGPNYTTGTISQTGNVITGAGGTAWTDSLIGGTITYQDASTATITGVTAAGTMTSSVSKTVTAGSTYSVAVPRHSFAIFKSQPQVAKYSRMIDTDTDVFPNKWLMNGLDNSTGAEWYMRYRSMSNTTTSCDVYNSGTIQQSGTTTVTGTGTNWTSSFVGGTITYSDLTTATISSVNVGAQTMVVSVSKTVAALSTYNITLPTMTTWGQETNYGIVSLGTPGVYTAKYTDGNSINCARFYYLSVSIDSSQAFGYPEDVSRGPTITDLSLFFTADPSKRLRHGKTFTGGELQPLDTPFP